jgi:hypothetical protein
MPHAQGRDLERRRVPRSNPVISTHINDQPTAIHQPGEEIRDMPAPPPAPGIPGQPERLA